MGNNNKLKENTAKQILQENPQIPHLTAAKLLHYENPELFPNIDNARNLLRRLTGNTGTNKRIQSSDQSLFRQPFTGEALPIPTPFWDSTPYILTTESCLVMGDIHIPFHINEAIELAVKYAKKRGVKDVILLGDILDHYSLSSFCRVPDISTLTQELKDGKQFLQWLRKKFPKGKIIFKEGNHEERFAIKLHKAVPEVGVLLNNFTYDKLGFEELGIDLVNDRRRIDCGYISLIHGHELGRGTSILVNAARTMQLRAKECSVVAHWHQPSQHRVRTLRQKHIGTWSIGCLCNLSPHYRPINDWELGFAVLKMTDDRGNFILDNKTIIDGNVV